MELKNHLLRYARFNLWANKKACDYLQTISDEQFSKEIVSSFPSMKGTMLHIWDAQFIWIKRLEGTSLSDFPSKTFSGNLEDIVQGTLETSRQVIDYVDTSGDAFLQTKLTYKNVVGDEFTNVVSDIIQHVVNHSTFHRGQIITMLRQLGFTKLFVTDYIAFCREQEAKVTA
jgi:uncharacterized damage-inducible protein DinB